MTVDAVIATARTIAERQLEAAEVDIEFADGVFTVAGTDRAMTVVDVAAAEPGLGERVRFDGRQPASPNGCHLCEVEIDEETGVVDIVGYTAVDDLGRVVNPMLVDGQIHGALAQGIGQALFECCVYDPDSGQLLSGSFMDYCLPRADDLPSFTSRDLNRFVAAESCRRSARFHC